MAESPDANKQNGFTTCASGVSYINYGEEDQMEVQGYRWSQVRAVVTWVVVVLTAGLARLVYHWYPHWYLYSTHCACPLRTATKLLILDNYLGKHRTYFVKNITTIEISPSGASSRETGNQMNNVLSERVRIQLNNGASKDVHQARAVRIKKLTYIWDEEREEFVKLAGLDKGVSRAEFHLFSGYNEHQQLLRRRLYGTNEIPVEVQSLMTLFLLEVINPFYIFQVFSLAVWISEAYYYYCIAIVIMSAFGIITTIVQTRKNQQSLQDTVRSSDNVTVWRGGDQYEEVPTSSLVPGDVIVIPAHGCDMHCDAVLLSGSCIVNESMLTGESVPVNKTALPRHTGTPYSAREDSNHTLYCGTKVIQTRFYGSERVCAVVLRTGFLTAKGSLVRAILYPPPADFRFEQDSYKFVGILAVVASLGFFYTVAIKVNREDAASDVAIKALDLITIVIPPALPAALSVGKMYAQRRLQAWGIFCINSRVINVAGSVDCVCFDKTGTLTEDGLDMWGVLPVESRDFLSVSQDVSKLKGLALQKGMACCHSLTIINGDLSGDPLDVKMFEATGWSLEEPEVADEAKYDLILLPFVKSPSDHEPPLEIGLIHQFQFSSTLQRMSVVTRELGSQELVLYCKGSPEMIVSLSRPDTVPADWSATLQKYTSQGYRVIAMGRRTLLETSIAKLQRMRREEAEIDLELLGLVILENRLKPETTDTIRILQGAELKIVMITGDNILTAVSVARECGVFRAADAVVDVTALPSVKNRPATIHYTTTEGKLTTLHKGVSSPWDAEGGVTREHHKLALTGNTWAVIKKEFPELVPRICARGAVFARMSSDQKQQLVQELQELGYCVAMCGDGANDCGALKAAHVGISLSEAESSVASPFTSKHTNISCVPQVVREGRGALSTSYGVFRFMVTYSLTQFLACLILYSLNSNLTDLQFIFIDLALIVNFAFFFGLTKAYAGKLVPRPPVATLLSLVPLASITLHMLIVAAVQLASFYTVRTFFWYPLYHKDPTSYACYENYAVFTVSLFQFIAAVVVFSEGKPYREAIYTNLPFITSLVAMTIICAYMTLYPASWILSSFAYILPPEYNFRVIVLCLAVVNFITVMFTESFVVNYLIGRVARPRDKEKKYEAVEKELLAEAWPPVETEAALTLAASVNELREPARTVQIQLKSC